MARGEPDYFIGCDPGFTGFLTVLSPEGTLIEFKATPVLKSVKKTTRRSDKYNSKGKLVHKAGHISVSTKKTLDEKAIKAYLRKFRRFDKDKGYRPEVLIVIEQQHARTMEGRASIAKTMYGFGFWVGLCRGLGFTVKVVRAVDWQKVFFQTTKEERLADKDVTKKKSIESVRNWSKELDLRKSNKSKKDDHNLADSINIARYGFLTFGKRESAEKGV